MGESTVHSYRDIRDNILFFIYSFSSCYRLEKDWDPINCLAIAVLNAVGRILYSGFDQFTKKPGTNL
jgi:hypothetical protein